MKTTLFIILSKKNQKLITMVDFLSNFQHWCKITDLAAYLGLSVRSTQRLLNELTDTFFYYNNLSKDTISLQVNKSNGVKLITANGMSSISRFIRQITMDDTTFQIARSLFFNTFDSPVKCAEKYGISLATVNYSLKKCSLFCQALGISFSTTSYKIIGSEQKIRIINYSITWFLNRGIFWPDTYKIIDEQKLLTNIDRLTTQIVGSEIIPMKKQKLAYFIATNILRIRQKNYVIMQPEWKTFFNDQTDSIVEIVQNLYKEYHIHNEAEIYYLSVYWQSESRLYQEMDTKNEVIEIHKNNQTIIYQLTNNFCELFSTEIISIPEKLKPNVFQQAFFTHLNCSISKVNDYFSYDTVLFEKNSAIFPNLINKLAAFIEKMYILTKNEIFINKEVLLRSYMAIYMTIKAPPLHEPPIYLYLETDLPYTEEVYIKNYLIKQFHHSFNLLFVETNFYKAPDVILSSISIDDSLENYCQIKLSANFQEPITHRSIHFIESKLKQLIQQKYAENNFD